ncbi:MAG TPA: hypothetical protein VFG83_15615 [Kofleriaceae bacterium]|nr:hypothetical protein [Kofleriaceae bacterium]
MSDAATPAAVTAAAPRPGAISVTCSECGASITVDVTLRSATCPYCASPQIVEQPAAPGPEPLFVLPFTVVRETAELTARRWLKGRSMWAPSGLAKALIAKPQGIYVPAYLYNAIAYSTYSARIGEEYLDTETYTDSEGNHHTRTVTRTEWHSLTGRRAEYAADIVVTASRGLPNDELQAIEPFNFGLLRRYDPALVSGWVTEAPSFAPHECVSTAGREATERIANSLAGFLPGDKHSDGQVSSQLAEAAAELLLAPVWVMSARYAKDKPPVRILVNGQTGKVAGHAPISWLKVTLTILLLAAFLGAMAWFLWLSR